MEPISTTVAGKWKSYTPKIWYSTNWANLTVWGHSFIRELFSSTLVWADVYPQVLIPAPCAVPAPARAAPQWIRTETRWSCHCWRLTNSNKSSDRLWITWNSYTKEGTHVPACQWTFSQGFNKNRSGPSNSLHQIQNWQAATDIGSFNSELSSKKQG